MAKENSFDITSKTDYAELANAINQTRKEISQRFDFKGSKALVDLFENDLILSAEDETKLRNMNDILQTKFVKRGISLKALITKKSNLRPAELFGKWLKSSREFRLIKQRKSSNLSKMKS